VTSGDLKGVSSGTMKWLPAFFLCLAFAQFSFHIAMVLKGEEWITSQLTIDDTYYYLETAWNTAHSGVPTFDGDHRTNGVQFLWFWIVTAIAAIVPSKSALLSSTIILCALLSAACYLPMCTVARRSGHPFIFLVCGVMWLNINLHLDVNGGSQLMGLENTLQCLVLWFAVSVFSGLIAGKSPTNREILQVGMVLAFGVLTRFEAIAIFLCFAGLLLLQQQRRTIAPLLVAFGSVIISFVVMALIYQWMAGTPTPVSALIKSQWPRWNFDFYYDRINGRPGGFFEITTRAFGDGFIVGQYDFLNAVNLAIAKLTRQPVLEFNKIFVAWTLALGTIVFFVWGIARHRIAADIAYPWVALGVGSWTLIFLYGQNISYWYLSGLTIWFLLGIGVVADHLLTEMGTWIASVPNVIRRIGLISFLALVIPATLFAEVRYLHMIIMSEPRKGLFLERYRLCAWLKATLPPGALISSYSSGQLGYFSGFRTVNLDGKINDYTFYKSVVRDRTVSIPEYLAKNNVDYVVDYNLRPEVLVLGDVIKSWEGNPRKIMQVLRLRH
jgi:hypothetical protein